ncbi:hypothetical protein SBOR_4470 [Sclerotinia borealis F-4128]|uniref:Uncharacterized protein n=1 Tax=Sclerotinia borealis (strain F-4128) TaxID=1432307 RepID=W9CGQ7_SCLBF|nr:hypothetical protein SBOR_4470 [Sclerotinia borealis F-4128]
MNSPPRSFSSAALKLYEDARKDGISVTERISLEKEGCKAMLENHFSDGYQIELNMVQRRPITIGHDNGEVVPSDYTSLNCMRRKRQASSNEPNIPVHCLHQYSHPYKEGAFDLGSRAPFEK